MKVGIERPLSNVKRYLESRNCSVEVLDSNNKDSQRALDRFDAIVVSGSDSNFMGMEDVITNTRVINANGKTEEEIFNDVSKAADLKKR